MQERINLDGSKKIITLLQYLIAIELAKLGISQQEIAKRLGIAKITVNNLLKDINFNSAD